MPRISVLMTTYNGSAFIADSIASILAQTYADFELIVVDDASTDATPAILAACRDKRLRVIRLEHNSGIVLARNSGMSVATGDYVAALDHDDLSHPERLQRQVAYLDANPGVVLLGTEIAMITDGRISTPDHPTRGDPLSLRWLLHTDNPLTWSSIMVRRSAVRMLHEFLRADYELADDFDLYHRLLAIGDIARLEDVLTTYRWHASNTTHDNVARQDARAAQVLCGAYARWLGQDAAEAAVLAIRHFSGRRPPRDAATLDALGSLLERLRLGFCNSFHLDRAQRDQIAALAGDTWWRTVRGATRAGSPWLLGRYRAHPTLATGFLPSRRDAFVSFAVGMIRAAGIRSPPAG